MGFTFFSKRRRELESKQKGLVQIDVIEQQYDLLIKDYAQLKTEFQALRFRRVQIKKQVDSLMELLGDNENENTDG